MDIETYEHKGYTIRIKPDDSPESPRTWSHVGTILSFHRSGDYGEVTTEDIHVPEQAQRHAPHDTATAIAFWTRRIKAQYGSRVVLPIWHYTHSGTTLRTGKANPFHCRWDSGLMGLIFDTPEGIAECYGSSAPPKARDIRLNLEGEVETFDQYLRGDVYGYVIEDADGVEVDSIWGFYGLEDVKEQAEDAVAGHIRYRAQEDAKIDRCMAI